MSWEEIKALVGDDAKLGTFIDSQESSSTENVTRINTLETKNNDLIVEVKNFKKGNTLTKSVLGIDGELNEDTLKEALGNKKGGDVELLSKYNANKIELDERNGVISKLESSHKEALLQKDVEYSYSELGINTMLSSDADDEDRANIKKFFMNGSTSVDGKTVFLEENGTTRYNADNKPYTMEDRKQEFLNKKTNASLISSEYFVKSGGSTKSSNSGGGSRDTETVDTSKHNNVNSFMNEALANIKL